MANTETEVKIKVPDLAAIARRLQALGAELAAPRVYEKNIRYEDAGETLTPAGRVVRLRQDTRARLTYKEPGTLAGKFLTRTELEITVSDFEITDLILQKLGYHSAWIYEKYRTTYTLDGCEVVLDEMPFGALIEIEGDEACIEMALKKLGLDGEPFIRTSYSDLFFRFKARLKLPFRDLTFENFKGITVPDALFTQE
ncbi:MAG TPA: class IV adenylate cyclase [Aggregatilineales bacterium]|nr:class IV adenylate cyclase [Aggregatilineales bacterium]